MNGLRTWLAIATHQSGLLKGCNANYVIKKKVNKKYIKAYINIFYPDFICHIGVYDQNHLEIN